MHFSSLIIYKTEIKAAIQHCRIILYNVENLVRINIIKEATRDNRVIDINSLLAENLYLLAHRIKTVIRYMIKFNTNAQAKPFNPSNLYPTIDRIVRCAVPYIPS